MCRAPRGQLMGTTHRSSRVSCVRPDRIRPRRPRRGAAHRTGSSPSFEASADVQDRSPYRGRRRPRSLRAEGRLDGRAESGREAIEMRAPRSGSGVRTSRRASVQALEAPLGLGDRAEAQELLGIDRALSPACALRILQAQRDRFRARLASGEESRQRNASTAAAGRSASSAIPFCLGVTLLEHGEAHDRRGGRRRSPRRAGSSSGSGDAMARAARALAEASRGAGVTCPSAAPRTAEGQKFCSECGAPLARACPVVRSRDAPGEKFCGECGAALAARRGSRRRDRRSARPPSGGSSPSSSPTSSGSRPPPRGATPRTRASSSPATSTPRATSSSATAAPSRSSSATP